MLPEESKYLDQLYHEHFPVLHSYAVKMLKLKNLDPQSISDLSEELIQDTFQTAAQNITTLMSHVNPGGYLMVTLKNKLREFSRQYYADQRLIHLSALPADLPDSSSALDKAQLGLEDEDRMYRVREALSPMNYQIFVQVALNHVSHYKVAQQLGITVWDSQKRLQRSRQTLKKIFGP